MHPGDDVGATLQIVESLTSRQEKRTVAHTHNTRSCRGAQSRSVGETQGLQAVTFSALGQVFFFQSARCRDMFVAKPWREGGE